MTDKEKTTKTTIAIFEQSHHELTMIKFDLQKKKKKPLSFAQVIEYLIKHWVCD